MNLREWLNIVENYHNTQFLEDTQVQHFANLVNNEEDLHATKLLPAEDVETPGVSLLDICGAPDEFLLRIKKARGMSMAFPSTPELLPDLDYEEEAFPELFITHSHRIEFKGHLDAVGNGRGRIAMYSLQSGLEESSLEGEFRDGLLEGLIREREFERWTRDVFYWRGKKHGYFRTFRWDKKFLEFGCFVKGRRISSLSCRKVEGCAYVFCSAQNCIYLYPGLEYGYVNGFFGQIGKKNSCNLAFAHGLPSIELEVDTNEPLIKYDPSTMSRISRTPLQQDPYEKAHVYVATSLISPLAGDGLFAKKAIDKGQLVSLFNGVRRTKEGRAAKAIGSLNEDWSDYRLTLDKATDLDIPPEFVHLDQYRATLGHKACHTFGGGKNSRFEALWHPRFGLIMSIVAIRNIPPHEEILVNYNYDLKVAPDWYKALWQNTTT